MKLYFYSIRDALTGFMTPVLEQNDAVAMRNFAMACDRSSSDPTLMRYRPADFFLYRLGSFDSESGVIDPLSPPFLVCAGDSIYKEAETNEF